VLFAAPTGRTPRFDDYTRGSYHVDKLDLARGLPKQAKLCGVELKALLVVGPVGPLWSYHVVSLVEDGSQVRVNSLVMPHARITGKGTGVLPTADAASMLDGITRSRLVRPGIPVVPRRGLDAEFSYRFLLVLYEAGRPRYFHADFDEFNDSPGRSELLDRANVLLSKTASTYRQGQALPNQ
jgi:hypothetical protein